MAKIMLVDDSKLVRKKLSDLFTRAGHTLVKECDKGEDAAGAYLTYRPDIVTMDMKLPGINGIEAIERIKRIDPNAKIIIISSESNEKTILHGIKAGAVNYLVKPFREEHVLEIIKRIQAGLPEGQKPQKPAPVVDENIKGLILLIDDSKTILKATSDMLKKDEHTVITAASGPDGIKLAQTGNPDLIILDVEMPGMDGYTVIKELKKNEMTRNIPIVMHTSKTRREDILTAMKLGVTDYISKSTSGGAFSAKVKAALTYGRIAREELAKNSATSIIVDRSSKNIIITFRFTVKSENAIAERKKIFSSAFIHKIKEENVIMDFRQITDMDSDELKQLIYIFGYLNDRTFNVICGKNYGAIVSEYSTDENIRFFISPGDVALFIEKLEDEKGETADYL